MSLEQIDAKLLRDAFITGAKTLEAKKEWINELNVFPVPDGDTGTNMTMTIMSATKEVMAIEDLTIANIAKAMSQGSLRGARGNSGVILSQLIRGFTKVIRECEEIDKFTLMQAMDRATETAYKAVMKPKEGTILTVARGMSDRALELHEEEMDMVAYIEAIIKRGEEVLLDTPNLLPVLKQAGVVDSGGQGLMVILNGALEALKGNIIDYGEVVAVKSGTHAKAVSNKENIETSDIKFGYCTEFIVNVERAFTEEDEDGFKEFLSSIGDSIVCVADEDVVKVHVHTNDPGLAIQKALTYGELTNMKIDNMREEHRERVIKDVENVLREQEEAKSSTVEMEHKDVGFISVSVGEGLGEIFRGIGADYLIEGGQTMNPSTDDILEAISKVNADTIFVMPNNKNIILAAEQAAKLTKDKHIVVIPSKTIPQGITAIISYMSGYSIPENIAHMNEEMAKVKTAQITYAVRDTTIDDIEIIKDDIMAIGDKGMLAAGKGIDVIVQNALEKLLDSDSELVTVYYGADVKEEEAHALVEKLQAVYEDVEIDLEFGGQPVYYYFISVE